MNDEIKNEKFNGKIKDKNANNKVNIIVFGLIVFIFISIIGYSIFSKIPQVSVSSVAQCLSDSGAILYASQYCTHCQAQKSMFGNYLNKINVVECSTNIVECQNAGITAYPTWEINGRKFVGLRDLNTLSDIAGCNLE